MIADLLLPFLAGADLTVVPRRYGSGALENAEVRFQALAHGFVLVRVRIEELDGTVGHLI
jgi:hypothetical protein